MNTVRCLNGSLVVFVGLALGASTGLAQKRRLK